MELGDIFIKIINEQKTKTINKNTENTILNLRRLLLFTNSIPLKMSYSPKTKIRTHHFRG